MARANAEVFVRAFPRAYQASRGRKSWPGAEARRALSMKARWARVKADIENDM